MNRLLKASTATLMAAMLVASASAAPSITAEVSYATQTAENGQQVAAIVRNTSGAEVGVVEQNQVSVTRSTKQSTLSEANQQKFTSAIEQLQNAENVVDLLSDEQKVELMKTLGADYDTSKLAASTVFDVDVPDSTREQMAAGNTVCMDFEFTGNANAVKFVLHNVGGTEWEAITDFTVNPDNTITVPFTSLSPVALVVDSESADTSADAPTSPQTGDNGNGLLLWIGGAFAAAAAGCFGVFRKKTH